MSEAKEVKVSFTTKVMAAGHASKTQRPDALFIDFFAEQLAGADAIQAAIPRLEEYEKQGRPFTSVRTRFFDDFLMNCHDIRQVVLLSVGMDPRAFRLNWEAGTHIYEIAHSNVLHYKKSVLAGIHPHCARHSICADLTESRWSQLLLEQDQHQSGAIASLSRCSVICSE